MAIKKLSSSNFTGATSLTNTIEVDADGRTGLSLTSTPTAFLQSPPASVGEAEVRFGSVMSGVKIFEADSTTGSQAVQVVGGGAHASRHGWLYLMAAAGSQYGTHAVYHYTSLGDNTSNSQLQEIYRKIYSFDSGRRVRVSLATSSEGFVYYTVNTWSVGYGSAKLYFVPMGTS